MAGENSNEDKQLEKLIIEIEKLRAETANLKSKIRYVPVISGIIAILVFGFGVYQFYWQEQEKIRQQNNAADLSERSFMQSVALSEKEHRRKFYEKQLETYFDLSQTASQIVALNDDKEIQKSYEHFLQLYNGNLIIVNTDEPENKRIWIAANNFTDAFNRYKKNPADKTELQDSARILSAILRNSIVNFWDIPMKEYRFENSDFFK
jgi:hypothetical protein